MRRGPYCLASPLYHPPLIVKPAKIFPSQCAGDRAEFFFPLSLASSQLFFILLAFLHFCLLGSPTDKADLARSSFCPAFPFTLPRPCVLTYSSQLESKSKSSLESFVTSQSQVLNYKCIAGGYVHSEIFPQL